MNYTLRYIVQRVGALDRLFLLFRTYPIHNKYDQAEIYCTENQIKHDFELIYGWLDEYY